MSAVIAVLAVAANRLIIIWRPRVGPVLKSDRLVEDLQHLFHFAVV